MGDYPKLKSEFDKTDMFGLISTMPDNLIDGMRIARDADLGHLETETYHSLVISGMGGSAIGGDLAKSLLIESAPIPIFVQRHYNLPGFVNKRSLVICSSYSGNTEETLSAYRKALSTGANLLVITSGGELASRAKADHVPSVIIPSGIPAPRAALGYSLAPLLVILFRLGLCPPPFEEIEDAASAMRTKLKHYQPENNDNPAISLAEEIHGKIPVIYAAQDNFDAVATRFKGQICENAECLAFANVFPEFNHNELVGWGELYEFSENLMTIIMRDQDDHPRIKARMDIIAGILREKGVNVHELSTFAGDKLTRILLTIQFADFVSYYLALLNQLDPTPVKPIDDMKSKLAKIK